MKGLNMSDEQPRTYSILELFKPVVLLVLIATSGIVVWSFYHFEWSGFLVYLVVAFVAGSMAGAIVRVPLISTWGVMGTAGGLFAGVSQGWRYGGWFGVVPGGVIGVSCGLVIAMLLSMCLSFVLVMCGINPFVCADGEGETKSNVA
ncbi:MAG: hypothetical protein JWP89_3650 [Schlesneria sp.]|nr:hypothetical protein [Schlesneria sp.]